MSPAAPLPAPRAPSPAPRPPAHLTAVLLLAAAGAWQLFVGLSVALAAQISLAQGGTDLKRPEVFLRDFATRPGILLASAAAIGAGLWALAYLGRLAAGRSRDEAWGPPSGGRTLALAGLAGAVASIASAGIGELIQGHGPFDATPMEAVGKAITSGGIASWVLIAVVVVLAPFAEELLFRGTLWSVLADRYPPRTLVALTGVVFAAWHLDPLQIVALLPAALVFGAVRARTGALLPCIAAHAAHNGVAVVLLLGAPGTGGP